MHPSSLRHISHPHDCGGSPGFHALISIKSPLPEINPQRKVSPMNTLLHRRPWVPLAIATVAIAALTPSLPAATLLQYTFAGGSAAPTTVGENVEGSNAAWIGLLNSGFSGSTNTAYVRSDSAPNSFDSGQYFEFTITADPGFVLNLESLEFRMGGQNVVGAEYTVYANVRTSEDFYASDLFINPGSVTTASHTIIDANTTTYANFTVDLSGFTDLTSLTLRLYPSDSLSSNNRFYRYDSVTLNGSVNAVPEPTALTLLAGSVGLLAILRRRRNSP
jgi:hypothetical protein